MSAQPRVAIIVLNWNGLEDTRACARSLVEQTYQPATVYLVDNGSTDGSAALLAAEFPQFIHIAQKTNTGFAVTNNEIMSRALAEGADHVLLLNNDTTVAPDFLGYLVDAMKINERVGMVVPKMYFYDRPDEIWYAGGRIVYREWPPFTHIGEGEKDVGQWDSPGEPDFATACCLLVHGELIRQVGMIDPTYGYYCEDVDWSLRARRAGWHLRYEPRALIWHRVNRSMQRGRIDPLYYSYRNTALVARRHLGFWRSIPVVWLAAWSAWKNARYAEPSRAALMEAAWDAIIGRSGIVDQPGSSLTARGLTKLGRLPSRLLYFISTPARLYRKFRDRDLRRASRARAATGRMRIAINIDGQFQAMTGIQHYVDSLIGALLETGTRHEIIAFAPALFASSQFEQHSRDGGFAWRNHPQARVDSAGSDRSFADYRAGRLFRIRSEAAYAQQKYASAGARARETSRTYDLLHVPCPVPLPFETYQARYCIATIYDLTPRLFPEAHDRGTIKAWERMFRFAEERCARVLTISENSRRDIVKHLQIDPERIDVTPLAPRRSTRRIEAGAERNAALKSLHLDPEVPFVLYAGTLEPRKNLPRLLQAFAMATNEARLNEHRLVLAGAAANDIVEQLRAHAVQLGVGDRLHFTGYVTNDAMNALMSACEVFAYVSEYEGFGLPPLEAMACGAPVVASNAASLPEVIGDAGLMVHPHDVEEMAAALVRLLTDPVENAKFRALSLQRAAEFTWARTAELTLQSYEAAVAFPKTTSLPRAA